MAECPQSAILLVEDDDFSRVITLAMLRSLGYFNVTTAENGAEAVHACRRLVFNLILMDLDMPVLTGLDAAVEIRGLGLQMPIVAYTASVTPATRAQCIDVGMSDFLPKPTDKAQLERTLHQWLGRSGV